MKQPVASGAAVPEAWFIDLGGNVISVPAEQAKAARDRGYRAATPEEIAAAQRRDALRAQYDTPGQAALAAMEGVGAGLTFGLSRVAEAALFDNAEAQRAREEFSPTAAMAGELGAIGAATLLTGGVAGALRGAGAGVARAAPGIVSRVAAATPPGLVMGLGRRVAAGAERKLLGRGATAAEEAIAKAAGESAAKRIGAKAAAEGLGSAVEGSFYGAGAGVSEAVLGDPERTAANIVADVGFSTILGGGLGGALGLTLGGGSRTIGEVVSSARRTATRLRDLMKERYVRQGAFMSGRPEAEVRALLDEAVPLSRGRRAETVLEEKLYPPESAPVAPQKGEPVLVDRPGGGPAEVVTPARKPEEWVERMTRDLDELRAKGEEIAGSLRDVKPLEMRALLPVDFPAEPARKALVQFVEEMRRTENAIRANPARYLTRYADLIKSVRRSLIRGPDKVPVTPDALDVFMALDRAKRNLDRDLQWGFTLSAQEKETVAFARGLRYLPKRILEDPAIFEEAAAAQAARNNAFSAWRTALDNTSSGEGSLFVKEATQQGKPAWRASGRKVRAYLKLSPQEAGELADEHVAELLEAHEGLLREMERSAAPLEVLVPEERARLGRISGAVREVKANAEQEARYGEAFRAAREDHRYEMEQYRTRDRLRRETIAEAARAMRYDRPIGPLDIIGFGSVWTTPWLAPLFGIYRLGHMWASPEFVARQLGTIERVNQRVDAAIRSETGKLVRHKAATVARTGTVIEVTKDTAKARSRGLARYNEAVAAVRTVAQNPEAAIEQLDRAGKPLDGIMPSTAQALRNSVARTAVFLAAKAPAPVRLGAFGAELPPSNAEIATWMRSYTAADKPLSILRQARDGTLTPEAVAAGDVAHPEFMRRWRVELLDRLTDPGTAPSYQARLMIAMILGRDVDGTMATAAGNQAAGAPPPPPAPQQGPAKKAKAGKITLPGRLQTPAQRAADRSP